MRRTVFAVLGVIAVVAATIASWIAIGNLGNSADEALAQTQQSVIAARTVAESSVVVANQIDDVLTVTNNGLNSTASALEATSNVSANLRKVIDLLGFIGSVDELSTSLLRSEEAMISVESDLRRASSSLTDALPKVTAAVAELRAVPRQLEEIEAQVQRSRDQLDQQVTLWRVALLATALVLILGIVTLWRLDRRIEALEDSGGPARRTSQAAI
jgi:uncharacterized protein (UPF0333 family)